MLKERQFNLLISNLSGEMDAVKTTIERLGSVPGLSGQMGEAIKRVRDEVGDLVSQSQQYGKLKVGALHKIIQ